MKKQRRLPLVLMFSLLLFGVSTISLGQAPPPPPPPESGHGLTGSQHDPGSAPVGEGMYMLIGLVGIYGLTKIYGLKKQLVATK